MQSYKLIRRFNASKIPDCIFGQISFPNISVIDSSVSANRKLSTNNFTGMRQDFRTFKILRMKHPCIIEERFELRLAADRGVMTINHFRTPGFEIIRLIHGFKYRTLK